MTSGVYSSFSLTEARERGHTLTQLSNQELTRRALDLEWLLTDVDGVLTDGRLIYGPRGESLKAFNVRDGLGLKLAQRAGIKVGILSSRSSAALSRRANELGLDALMAGSDEKESEFDRFLGRRATSPRRVAYIGDDLPDIPILGRVGLAFCPADAAPEVRAVAHLVLDRVGGRGAVREAVERLLEARGQWKEMISSFTFES